MDARWHHAAQRVRRRTPVLLDLGLATMVITPGEKVRQAAIERFRLHPDRVVAVPEARGSLVPSGGRRAVRRAPYFLFVGTLEPRKNLETLVEAWREVRRTHAVDLVLAGRRRADAPRDRARSRDCAWRAKCRIRELPALYSGALALSTRRSTKASDCRCWRRCSAARR